MFKKLSTNMEDSMHFHQTSMDSVLIMTLHNRLRRESSERGIKFLFADAKRPFFCIRWPKYWSFSFNINPSSEYSGLISFRTDWFDLLAVQMSRAPMKWKSRFHCKRNVQI